MGATELIMALGPLNLHSDAGHRNQEGNLCHLGGFSGQAKTEEANRMIQTLPLCHQLDLCFDPLIP